MLELLHEYDVSVALDGENALEYIEKEKPDLILLDVSMPGMDGYEVCSILKGDLKTKDIPILFLSANTDADSIVKGFDAGGVDYIVKPYRPKEVLARVETHLKLNNAMIELEKLAREDPLTGIANRRRFFEDAQTLFSDAKSKLFPLYLFVVDIDRFKEINDTFGHDIGDEVIKSFAQVVNENLGDDDCFARLGGDEFTIVLTHTTYEEAFKKAEIIRQSVEKMQFDSDVEVHVTISMGMAAAEEYDEKIDSVIKRADENLYKAKSSTRNQVRG
ncbi:MAG: diguanylate cyclase response regulator [Epsilonproteobacteria bacterium]|nr:MAG: diguanylate cyclase response regulator [Campylobacterota bacterium]